MYGEVPHHPSEALHHTTAMVDVQGSSALINAEKLAMRAALVAAVDAAIAFSQTDRDSWRLEDRGDGRLVTVSAAVPKVRIVGAWVEGLDRALRAHNAEHPRHPPVRVRVGVHAGEVHRDAEGIAGSDLELACRIADAPIAKRVLRAAGAAALVLVVSQVVYDSVVRHGGRFLDPARFRLARATVKETDVPVWLYVPGYPTPPEAGEDAPPAAGSPAAGSPAAGSPAAGAAPAPARGPVSMRATAGEHSRIYQSAGAMTVNE
jgi:hypothetical protein